MQAKIETLKAKNANEEEYLVYPRTLTKCVVDENGNNIEVIVENIVSDITDDTLDENSVKPISNGAVTAELNNINDRLDNVTASKTVDITLQASKWQGDSAPYNNTFGVDGITATNDVIVIPKRGITVEQEKAMSKAKIITGVQNDRNLNLFAYGKKPTIDLPITIIIKGV